MNESEQWGERENSISPHTMSLQQSEEGGKIINAIKCGQINQMPQTNYENITGGEFSITSNGV